MNPVFNFTPSAQLDRAILAAEKDPGAAGFLQLLHAVQARRIALTAIMNNRVVWTPRDLRSRLPTVVLISDDAGDSRNPDEWRCAISAIAWARSIIIHGTGAQAWHYIEAIRAAERTSRCLMVETDSAHAGAWLDVVTPRQVATLGLVPGSGQHPVEGESQE